MKSIVSFSISFLLLMLLLASSTTTTHQGERVVATWSTTTLLPARPDWKNRNKSRRLTGIDYLSFSLLLERISFFPSFSSSILSILLGFFFPLLFFSFLHARGSHTFVEIWKTFPTRFQIVRRAKKPTVQAHVV